MGSLLPLPIIAGRASRFQLANDWSEPIVTDLTVATVCIDGGMETVASTSTRDDPARRVMHEQDYTGLARASSK